MSMFNKIVLPKTNQTKNQSLSKWNRNRTMKKVSQKFILNKQIPKVKKEKEEIESATTRA